jgi:hypothetical protein
VLDTVTHFVIPDTQVAPGTPTDHLRWIGEYLVDEFYGKRVEFIQGGDWWDMKSLSSYDRGMKAMEGRRYSEDVEAGNAALDVLMSPLLEANKGARKKWKPRQTMLRGNHENRIVRAIEANPQLEGLLGDFLFNDTAWGWQPVPFLEPKWIDGICYAHYFHPTSSSRPYGSAVEPRIKTIGHSFTMFHQQGLKIGRVETLAGARCGLVAGSCYLHDEDYMGPQGNKHWRGIVVCHDVRNGEYEPMPVTLSYLCRRYEGVELADYMKKVAA